MSKITIKQGSIDDLVDVTKQIKEFEVHFSKRHFTNILKEKSYSIMVAYDASKPVGYTCGYINSHNGWFENWVSAVLKPYRKQGIMSLLYKQQEKWVKIKGINRIVGDINQRNISMLILCLKAGYYISGYKFDNNIKTSKVFVEKNLSE